MHARSGYDEQSIIKHQTLHYSTHMFSVGQCKKYIRVEGVIIDRFNVTLFKKSFLFSLCCPNIIVVHERISHEENDNKEKQLGECLVVAVQR